MTLDRKSTILVTLADKSKRAATVQPPGGGGGGEDEGNKNDPSNAGENGEAAQLSGRNFIESWPLDLSAFLGGETSISMHVGGSSGGCATEDLASTRDVAASRESLPPSSAGNQQEDQPYNSRSDAPPAPEGIRFLKLSVCLPGTKAATTVEDQDPTPASEGGGTAATSAGGEGTTGCGRKKLLSTEAMERLNPLSIKISSAMSLPGVRIEAESLQGHVKPTSFRLLDLHCKPVYAVCRPFPDDPSGESLHPRILWTAGWAQRDLVRFEHTASFLLGPMDRHRLEDWVENSTLSVEVHDRYVCTCTNIGLTDAADEEGGARCCTLVISVFHVVVLEDEDRVPPDF